MCSVSRPYSICTRHAVCRRLKCSIACKAAFVPTICDISVGSALCEAAGCHSDVFYLSIINLSIESEFFYRLDRRAVVGLHYFSEREKAAIIAEPQSCSDSVGK